MEISQADIAIGTLNNLITQTNSDEGRAERSPRSEAMTNYINNGLSPNLVGMFHNIHSKIESAPNHNEVIDLKERCFVETIQQLTHPEIRNRLTVLGDIINENDPKPVFVALVPVGSAAFGGLLVREAVGSESGTDIDLFATYTPDELNGSASPDTPSGYIIKTVGPQIKALFNSGMLKRPDTKEYPLCDAHRVESHHSESIQSKEDATELLHRLKHPGNNASIVYEHMLPSYPPWVNELARFHILSALSDLAQKEPEEWKQATSLMISSFNQDVRPLKTKHFGKKDDPDLESAIKPVNDFMTAIFADMILETGVDD